MDGALEKGGGRIAAEEGNGNPYSCLKLSIGFCSEARLAGKIPKIRPTVMATKNESATEKGEIMVCISATCSMK